MFSTDAPGSVVALETPHRSAPALDATMVLFKVIVQIGTGPMPHSRAQHSADRSGVGLALCRCAH